MGGVERIINGYQEAEDAANYAEAIELEMRLNSGADYSMVWTEAYQGAYPPENR